MPSSASYATIGATEDEKMLFSDLNYFTLGAEHRIRVLGEVSRAQHSVASGSQSSHFQLELNGASVTRTQIGSSYSPYARQVSITGIIANTSPNLKYNISLAAQPTSSGSSGLFFSGNILEYRLVLVAYPTECVSYLQYIDVPGLGELYHPTSPAVSNVATLSNWNLMVGPANTTVRITATSDVFVVAEVGRFQSSTFEEFTSFRLVFHSTVIDMQSYPTRYYYYDNFKVVHLKGIATNISPGTYNVRIEYKGASIDRLTSTSGFSETRITTQAYPIQCFGRSSTHPSVCSGNGVCTASDTCTCNFGTSGPQCENILRCDALTAISNKKWEVSSATGSSATYFHLPIQQMSTSYYVTKERPSLVIQAMINSLSRSVSKCAALLRIMFNNDEVSVTNVVPVHSLYNVYFTGFVTNAPSGWANISVQYKIAPRSSPFCFITFGTNSSTTERSLIIESFAASMVVAKRVYNATSYSPNGTLQFQPIGANEAERMQIEADVSFTSTVRVIAEVTRIQHQSSSASFSHIEIAINSSRIGIASIVR